MELPANLRGLNLQNLVALVGGIITLLTVALVATGVAGSSTDAGSPAEGQSTILVKKADGTAPSLSNCQLTGVSPEDVVQRTDSHGVYHRRFEPGEYTVAASCLVASAATSSKETLEGETTFSVADSPVNVTITVK